MPNLDHNFKHINDFIKYFCNQNKNFIYKKSFGSKEFLSILKYSNCIIGNSSSGIIEAPNLKIPTINIGNRQKGRLMSKSVINSDGSVNSLKKAFKKVLNINKSRAKSIFNNPYDSKKNLSELLSKVMLSTDKNKLLPKKFYDK